MLLDRTIFRTLLFSFPSWAGVGRLGHQSNVGSLGFQLVPVFAAPVSGALWCGILVVWWCVSAPLGARRELREKSSRRTVWSSAGRETARPVSREETGRCRGSSNGQKSAQVVDTQGSFTTRGIPRCAEGCVEGLRRSYSQPGLSLKKCLSAASKVRLVRISPTPVHLSGRR